MISLNNKLLLPIILFMSFYILFFRLILNVYSANSSVEIKYHGWQTSNFDVECKQLHKCKDKVILNCSQEIDEIKNGEKRRKMLYEIFKREYFKNENSWDEIPNYKIKPLMFISPLAACILDNLYSHLEIYGSCFECFLENEIKVNFGNLNDENIYLMSINEYKDLKKDVIKNVYVPKLSAIFNQIEEGILFSKKYEPIIKHIIKFLDDILSKKMLASPPESSNITFSECLFMLFCVLITIFKSMNLF